MGRKYDEKFKARQEGAATYATALEVKWLAEGIEADLAKSLAEKFYEAAERSPGVPLFMIERTLLRDVLVAQRESQIRRLPRTIAERYHLPVEVVERALRGAIRRLQEDPKLLVRVVLARYEDELKGLSERHYHARRAAASPLAAELVAKKLA